MFVAQRIEHPTTDQKVGGSSPSKRTESLGVSYPPEKLMIIPLTFRVRHQLFNSFGENRNPITQIRIARVMASVVQQATLAP